MSKNKKRNFFSVPYQLINTEVIVNYDLFVNSSSIESREHFVRIFPVGEQLQNKDIEEFKRKYQYLYVPEDQRNAYMTSLVKSENFSDVEKTQVVKDAALQHLANIFDKDREFSTEFLSKSIENCREAVESMVEVFGDYSVGALQELVGELSFHDFYTYDHSVNVSMYCIAIYRALRPSAPRSEVVTIGLGGLLHDLGKTKIATEIINKAGKLNDEEYNEIKRHPDLGYFMIQDRDFHIHETINVEEMSKVIHQHHENWDGTGYPGKLKGEEISYMARVCCIADFFDAITTKRSYSESLPLDDALAIMAKTKGKKIDPKIFDFFLEHLKKFIPQGKMRYELDSSFDPTMPHKQLPLVESAQEGKTQQDYGAIKIVNPDDD